MANECFFNMKVRGAKSDCKEWFNRLLGKSEKDNFHMVYSAVIAYEGGSDDDYSMEFYGSCAWALGVMCDKLDKRPDLFSVSTRDLNLKMEAWSDKYDMAFEEHFVYDHGYAIENALENYEEAYWDKNKYPTYEDFLDDYPDAPDEATVLDNDGWYKNGGFEDSWGTWSI